MTAVPAAGYISNAAREEAEFQTFLENLVSLIKEIPGGTSVKSETLSSGVFSLSNNYSIYEITSESGNTDTLTEITVGAVGRDGQTVILKAASGHTITLQDGTGNAGELLTKDSANLVLSDERQYAVFRYDSANTAFEEVHRDLTFLVNKLPGVQAANTKTIATGSISPDQFMTLVDTEGAASTDNLDFAATASAPELLLLGMADSSHEVVIRHNQTGSGKFLLANSIDLTIQHPYQFVMFRKSSGNWSEVGRFGFRQAVLSKTSGFTASYNSVNKLDSSSAGFTATLPTAVGHKGDFIVLWKVSSDSNAVTLGFTSSQTANGSGSWSITSQYTGYALTSDGTNWIANAIEQTIGNSVSAFSELTISGGVVTPTGDKHTVDTESNAAADDLNEMAVTNLPEGSRVTLMAADAARTIVIKHNAGSTTNPFLLYGDTDFSIDDDEKSLDVVRVGSNWVEVGRNEGASGSAGITPIGSPLSSIAANTLYTQAHGLGYTPSDVVVVATCTTIDHGWQVGEKLTINGNAATSTSGYGVTIAADGTNLIMKTSTFLPLVVNKGSATVSTMTGGSWSWQFGIRGSN